ncbi:hypothetical protein MTR67_042887 [Solanum verrucosum]|uniref:Uncharacterized protein n=1 Tax=Solanum verrucosum TaxID=315347 RepID=A0AAF0ZRK0_SOLVR|nr:hypothetical protein MTR67_042887 [Solanum verrucosum]
MVLLPRTAKRTMDSSANLFLIENLDELEAINHPRIMLELMHQIMTWRNAKHVIAYEYLLNLVFDDFEVPLARGVSGTIKQTFSMATLIEYECVQGKVVSGF